MDTAIQPASTFELFGVPHILAMALIVVVAAGLPVLSRRMNSRTLVLAICVALSAILLLNELVFYVYGLSTKSFDEFVKKNLPLHICGVAVYLVVFVLFTRRQFAYEVAFFWGLAGTLQAIITPNIIFGWPSYNFVQFFVGHGGIVVAVLFATWALKMRPRLRSVFYTWLLSNLCVAAIGTVNLLLDANYMFLCRPPVGDSPFFFLPWPWYILFLEPIGLALFLLLYLPFPIADRIRRSRTQKADVSLDA